MPKFIARKQFETGLRGVIGIALGLAAFDPVQNAAKGRIFGATSMPGFGQAAAQIGLPGLVGHRDDAGVADHGGFDVLVGGRILEDRAGVQPGLMGKGR